MKGVSITGLVLGVVAQLVMFSPVIGALLGAAGFVEGGWALLFFTVPVGLVLAVVAAILCIIAAGMSLRRGTGSRVPSILGIALVIVGLLLQPVWVGFVVVGADPVLIIVSLALALGLTLVGVVLCTLRGLRGAGSRPAVVG
jgi:hypothetical protein